jgi:HSP20 family protein
MPQRYRPRYAPTVAKRDADKLQEEIAELFADLWQVRRFAGVRGGFRPPVDRYHTDDPHELTVVVELPGVDPQSLTLAVAERVLVVAGERVRPRVEGRVYQQMEIEYGPFKRQIRLAEDVDPENARARYERGYVIVTLPVAEGARPRGSITIEVLRG